MSKIHRHEDGTASVELVRDEDHKGFDKIRPVLESIVGALSVNGDLVGPVARTVAQVINQLVNNRGNELRIAASQRRTPPELTRAQVVQRYKDCLAQLSQGMATVR